MQCRNVLTHIDAMRTDEIGSQDRDRIREHLDDCPSCEESVFDLEGFAALARSLRQSPSESLADRVCSAVLDSYDSFDLDGDRVWVAFSSAGLRMVDIAAADESDFRERYRKRFARELKHATIPENYRKSVEAAMLGLPIGLDAIDFSGLTEFERDVLTTIRKIPRGEVRPYAWVARAVRRPRAIRAVGNVMANNPMPFVLPCHRVVPSGGGVGNYAFGPDRKKRVLRSEGAPIELLDSLAREGVRFVGSATTRIYCFPSCRDARRIREENRVPFRNAEDASRKGFRACLRCTPETASA